MRRASEDRDRRPTRETAVADMKWWGWGPDGEQFTVDDKPALGPFIADKIGVDVDRVVAAPPRFASLAVPESRLPQGLHRAFTDALGLPWVSTDPHDRVVHPAGKSLRALTRQRRGALPRVPDVVLRPASENEAGAVLRAALDHDAVVSPFGGGSSISGSLE